MKMSSAMLINKKCHSHQWLISGLQMWIRAPKTVIQGMLPTPPSMVMAEELWKCKMQGEQGNRIGPRYLSYTWKEWIQWAQSDFTFTFHFYALEKEMATHSSVLAWRIPGTGSHRVGHDWSDLAAVAEAYIFPYCRMLNSLTWYLTFDVQTACSLFCKLVYSLTSPASLELFSQSCWEAVSRARGTKHSPK